uniref:Uncharacterized protein n=1 Tax=Branchiostoma floridae TaxID=7739 RepID=C3Y1N8_BRAFL|eukprot:XP_002609768.1 hypothetical protein BRAFLDRAFT_78600 [Branchiostoma floridae]
MAAHRLLVEQHERTEPLRQELARQQSRIAALTAQILKLGQVNREQERQMQLRQDMEVLRKRNRAQLTRLRRCVDETERRNEQWNQEASRLEEATAQLQREVDGTQPEDATAQMRGEKGKGK